MFHLGCARRYDVTVTYQGGKEVHTHLDGITQLTWGRKLGDYSEASVTLGKRHLSPRCRAKLGEIRDNLGKVTSPGIEPWMHEITILRDGIRVWVGPIVEVDETRDTVEINARDMLTWMDRRVVDLTFAGAPDPQQNQYSGETGAMLREIFTKTWPGTHEQNPWDNPGLTEFSRIDDTPGKTTQTDTIWKGSRTVGDLVRDVIQNGVDMFTLGRRVYLVPDTWQVSRSPHRLTEDHILGDITVRKLGLDLATEGFVVGQSEGVASDAPMPYGKWPPNQEPGSATNPCTPPYYGRITRLSQSQALTGPPIDVSNPQQNPSSALQQVAQAIRDYGFPCPIALIIGDNAALAPNAPVSIGQLVPSAVFHVELSTFITNTSDFMKLSEVEVTWSPNQSTANSQGASSSASTSPTTSSVGRSGNAQGAPEQVQVSLVSLRQPPIPSDSGSGGTGAPTAGTIPTSTARP